MLSSGNRLRRSADFSEAVRRGRRFGGATLVAHLTVADRIAPPRVGFIVGRAVGPAVTRNRVKRRLRHLARARLHRLDPGTVLVVRALPAAATASGATLGAELDATLRSLLDAGAR
jgi:ribonuclease P protein component